MQFNRNLKHKILELLDKFPIIGLLGVRQCGKTDLIRNLFPDWRYLDLEDPEDYDLLMADPKFFFRQNPTHLILDEAQMVPELFPILRGIVDSDREEMGRFIITGSSSPELVRNISESLAGRIRTITVSPLKMNEFYGKDKSSIYESIFIGKDVTDISDIDVQFNTDQVFDFWFHGGYPEPSKKRISDKSYWQEWMQAYFDTYLNRDIRKLFPKLNITRFRRFVQMLAQVSGTQLTKRDLAQSLDVSEPVVKEYLDIVHETYAWRNLSSFDHNIQKQISKMPRGYIRDSGLLHFLLKMEDFSDLERYPRLGNDFESFVIEEILKGLESSSVAGWEAHYYRTRSKSEIDLIIHSTSGITPIEIKYGRRVSKSDYKTLQNFVREHNLPVGILINNSEKPEWISDRILQLPVGCI